MGDTIEKRLNITPSPTVGPLVRELAKLTGKGPATIVREILDESAPALQIAVEAFRQIKQRPEAAQAAVLRMAAQAHHDLAQLSLDIAQVQGKKPGRKPAKKATPPSGTCRISNSRRRTTAIPLAT